MTTEACVFLWPLWRESFYVKLCRSSSGRATARGSSTRRLWSTPVLPPGVCGIPVHLDTPVFHHELHTLLFHCLISAANPTLPCLTKVICPHPPVFKPCLTTGPHRAFIERKVNCGGVLRKALKARTGVVSSLFLAFFLCAANTTCV